MPDSSLPPSSSPSSLPPADLSRDPGGRRPPTSIPPAIQAVPDDAPPLALTWAHLRNRNPDYDAEYWRALRALLEGGKRLLHDDELMRDLFPRHPNEDDDVYQHRRARAFFIPYPGEIIGDLVGLLDQDPVDVRPGDGAGELDDFYANTFLPNVDRKGTSLTGFAQVIAREALTVGRCWTLCELPARSDGDDVLSLLEQEQRDLLRAYVEHLPAERVLDWERDDDGALLWAVVHQCTKRRPDPAARRDTITDVFTVYTRSEWHRFVITYPDGRPPNDDEVFTPVQKGAHTFGGVPLLCFDLPAGLWAMDKLFGIARAHFNQRSALSYAQFKHLFPILTAYLGPEMGGGGAVPAEAQQSPTRATEQTYGVGRVHVFGKDDRLEYTSPDSGVFTFAASDLKDLRDEMHRVTYTMAASMEGSSAAVGRSGDSKREDRTAKERVLSHLGVRLCAHLKELLRMIARGRGDNADDNAFTVTGLSSFDEATVADAIESAQVIESLTIPSATFKRVHRKALARKILARDASAKELDAIDAEIDANVADEDFAPLPPRNPPPGTPNAQQPPGNGQQPPAAGGARPAIPLPSNGAPALRVPKAPPAPRR